MWILYLVFFVIFLTGALAAVSSAPWLPTRGSDVKRMMELAQIKKGDIIYDLGCGDGRFLFAAAKCGAKAIGVELFLLPYWYAKIRSFFNPHVKVIFGDYYRKNISDADVVFIFLMNRAYPKLLKKFNQELKDGARVIVSCWPITEWQPVKIDKPDDARLPIYVYKYKKSV